MSLFWEDARNDQEFMEDTVSDVMDYALMQGLLLRTKEQPTKSEVVNYFPIALLPSPVPKALFDEANAVQQDFNLLVDLVSQDYGFLEGALESTVKADNFIAQLFSIYKHVVKEGLAQSVFLGINRSDYMFHCEADGTTALKQVEINTIAAAAGGLSSKITNVHRYVLNIIGKSKEASELPPNNPSRGIGDGIETAWKLYGSEKAHIMVMVEDKIRNIFDQRSIEKELWKRNICVVRRSLEDVSERATLDEDRRLYIDGHEVAVIYFRTGYLPMNYHEQGWAARLLMERSRAVKCPDVATQLTGTKKVQQELSRPGALERFLPGNPEAVARIRATFAGLYSLDEGEEGDQNAAMAIKNPEQFVLKPELEGGGNNIFGDEIKHVLGHSKDHPGRTSYILMDKIMPHPIKTYLLKGGSNLILSNCLSELGIFGVYVRQGRDMILNEQVGHLLRTKSTEFTDGGILAGIHVLDSPYLV
ncbi:glutathione synthetase-like [Lissotriton helveticus]